MAVGVQKAEEKVLEKARDLRRVDLGAPLVSLGLPVLGMIWCELILSLKATVLPCKGRK